MNKALIERIEELFNEGLQAKTGWGRNEVKELLSISIKQALMEQVD
jgi:hypothetical protein